VKTLRELRLSREVLRLQRIVTRQEHDIQALHDVVNRQLSSHIELRLRFQQALGHSASARSAVL
jgi:hypothetical protein